MTAVRHATAAFLLGSRSLLVNIVPTACVPGADPSATSSLQTPSVTHSFPAGVPSAVKRAPVSKKFCPGLEMWAWKRRTRK